jgi:ketosteroid isomerase-like protein
VSQSNVELARSALRAFEQRDINAIETLCTPDVEFDWSRRLLDPTVTRGYDGVRQFFEEVDGIFDEIVFDEEEVVELGDDVLVVSTGHFRGRTSGVDVTAHGAILWTVRGGRLARFRFYQTKEDALEARLSEGGSTASAASAESAPLPERP